MLHANSGVHVLAHAAFCKAKTASHVTLCPFWPDNKADIDRSLFPGFSA